MIATMDPITTMTEESDDDMAKKKAADKADNKVRFVLMLDPEQKAALERIQEDTGAPIAVTIRRAIDNELEARKKGGRHGR